MVGGGLQPDPAAPGGPEGSLWVRDGERKQQRGQNTSESFWKSLWLPVWCSHGCRAVKWRKSVNHPQETSWLHSSMAAPRRAPVLLTPPTSSPPPPSRGSQQCCELSFLQLCVHRGTAASCAWLHECICVRVHRWVRKGCLHFQHGLSPVLGTQSPGAALQPFPSPDSWFCFAAARCSGASQVAEESVSQLLQLININ